MIDFSTWEKNFWEYVGEKPYIFTPDGKWRILYPMTQLFNMQKWLPLNDDYYDRLRMFINADDKLKGFGTAYIDLANLACTRLRDNRQGGQHVKLAANFLGEEIGPQPEFNREAYRKFQDERKSLLRRYTHGRYDRYTRAGKISDPNQPYHDWLRKRDAIMDKAIPYVNTMVEYLLRHIVNAEDYPVEFRHKILENLGRKLFLKYWKSVSGGYGVIDKIICCTKAEWDQSVRQNLPEYINDAARIMWKICRFTAYDFSAIKSIIGDPFQAICKMLEAQAATKINAQLQDAMAQYDKFKDVALSSATTGAMRENEHSFECKILMYRIKVNLVDIGKGTALVRKISENASNAAVVGLGTAALGAVLAFPPLLGIGAIGMMLFGDSLEKSQKKRRR